MDRAPIKFAFATAPTGAPGLSDAERYREVLADCRLGQALGYDGAWMLEHHFTDYFPTPSPLLLMSHVAAHCPRLNFGSCVLVAPWYQPIRLAEEIAMLTRLMPGELHLGLGRGTAKLEYDAYGVDMAEARDRFRECMEILRRALTGEPFAYEGVHYRVGRKVRVRPTPDGARVHLYGAIGSPQSAPLMAELGLPPLCTAQFPPHILERIMAEWSARAAELKLEAVPDRPLMVHLFLADSDERARALGRAHLADFFALQARHYESEANYWQDIKGYEQFSKFFANLEKLARPENLDPFMDNNLVGSAKTVRAGMERLIGLGFNHFVIMCATEGIPRGLRADMLRRFAVEVAPAFAPGFGVRRAIA